MKTVYPDYYNEFHCLGGRCVHNCCIGWEIDIDDETALRYRKTEGELGDRLRGRIAWEDTPHFILTEKERCPFLNKENLCDVIIGLGQEGLCAVCREHPRFRNELPERVEIGLGLCCEEAARLILGKREPVALIVNGSGTESDDIINLRDDLLSLLQNRSLSLEERLGGILSHFGISLDDTCIADARGILMSLERMNEEWSRYLDFLSCGFSLMPSSPFAAYMADREFEYENLAVYMIYRYVANAWSREEAALRTAFAVFCVWLLRCMGEAVYRLTGRFTFNDQIELCRLFSAEIEYSVENRDALFDWLSCYLLSTDE